MTMDERIVSDILFGDQSKMGQFRGGGDKVGAALANFINARNDARNRALRNQEWDTWTKSRNSGSNNNNQLGGSISNYAPSGKTLFGADANGVYGINSQADRQGIGADENGIYGINSQADQQGIGANANGVYGVAPATASNNKYTFNESDYIPSAGNSYHINDNPRMAEWGSSQDWQMQQARNAMRDIYEGSGWYKYPYNGFGSAIAKAEQPQREVDRYPQELVGLTGEDLQRAGQAYNQWVDGGRVGNFANAIVNAERAVAPQVAPRVQPTPQYTPQPKNTPSVADFKRNEYNPYEDDYIPMEGTVKEIQAKGLADRQKNFTNAQANRAGAQEIQRGYNPQGGHSKDPSLYYFTNTIPSLINRKPEYPEDYKNVPQIGDY